MKNLITYGLFALAVNSCSAQEKMTLKYVGQHYVAAKNSSFTNNQLVFLKGSDTVLINQKIPFATGSNEIVNKGVYRNCHLQKGIVYTLTLKRVCVNDIADVPNNYYKINTIVDKANCSKFMEIEKNTPYEYNGNYGKYVDMKNTLYEITGLTPDDDCTFQH